MNKMCGGIESLWLPCEFLERDLKFEALFSFLMNLFLLTHGKNNLVL
jgi:hypothetical protein